MNKWSRFPICVVCLGLICLALAAQFSTSVVFAQKATQVRPAAPSPTATPPPLRDDGLLHEESLLATDSSCSVPCWHGITPGETAWQDALTRLENDPVFEIISVSDDSDSEAKSLDFRQAGGLSCCVMIAQDGETVSVIFLRVAPTMTLGEVIDVLGTPEYLVGSPYSDDQAVVNLIYPDKLLIVYVFVAGTDSALSQSSEIIGILYMQPSEMNVLVGTSRLHRWKGYQAYQEYGDSGFDVTPSMTLTPTPRGR